MARAIDHPYLLQLALSSLGAANDALLRWEDARATHQQQLEIVRMYPNPQHLAQAAAMLCANRASAGDWAGAHRYAVEARAARGHDIVGIAAIRRHCEIEALLRSGDEQQATDELRRLGRQVATNRRLRITYLRSLALLAWWQKDTTDALAQLQEASALAEEIGLPGEQWQIAQHRAALHRARGEMEQVEQAQVRADAALQVLADRIVDPGLRTSFLTAATLVPCGLGARV